MTIRYNLQAGIAGVPSLIVETLMRVSSPLLRSVATLTLIVMALGALSSPASARAVQVEAFTLLISTAACSTDGGATALLCEPLAGLTVTVATDGGDEYGSCVTQVADVPGGLSSQCSVDVPFESTGTVALDETGVPAGNVVVTTPLTFAAPTATEFFPETDIATIRFTIVPEDEDTGNLESETLAIGATICDSEEPVEGSRSGGSCEPFADASITVTDEDGNVAGSCTLERYDSNLGSDSTCAVQVPFNATYALTLDADAIPEGYVAAENPISFTAGNYESGGGDGPDVSFQVFLLRGAEETTGTDPTAVPSNAADTETVESGAAGTGSPAAIYAGDCDVDFTETEAVAVLSEVTEPQGEERGAESASAAETSFTTLDLPLEDMLTEAHVLVVFDEDDDTVVLACGTIGGIVTDDGALTFGLPAVGESHVSGVAYFTEDGDQTAATIFLTGDLSGAEETPEA